MIRVVTEGRSGELAWDLYAGVGLFSRVLMRSFAQVVAVEGSRMHLLAPSAERKNLRSVTPGGFAEAFYLANHWLVGRSAGTGVAG